MTPEDETPTPAGCPVHNNGQAPTLPGRGDTDYERYMRVDDLLDLRKPAADLVHHDELMFQTVHQTFELWCHLVLHEFREVRRLVQQDELVRAMPLIDRCTQIVRLQTDAMHILETMTPRDFHVIRAALGQGSGAESPGFRRILEMGPKFWPVVAGLLERRSTDLEEVYRDQEDAALLRLLESLTDFDMFFHVWRLNHLAMVKRVIGRDVKSLKGYAVHQLEEDVQQVLWPELWSVRNTITEITGTSPA